MFRDVEIRAIDEFLKMITDEGFPEMGKPQRPNHLRRSLLPIDARSALNGGDLDQ